MRSPLVTGLMMRTTMLTRRIWRILPDTMMCRDIQDMTTNRCGAIQGTLIYNVSRASAGLNATAGAFSGTPWGPVAPGLAAVQSQLASAYSAAVSDAGTVGMPSRFTQQSLFKM